MRWRSPGFISTHLVVLYDAGSHFAETFTNKMGTLRHLLLLWRFTTYFTFLFTADMRNTRPTVCHPKTNSPATAAIKRMGAKLTQVGSIPSGPWENKRKHKNMSGSARLLGLVCRTTQKQIDEGRNSLKAEETYSAIPLSNLHLWGQMPKRWLRAFHHRLCSVMPEWPKCRYWDYSQLVFCGHTWFKALQFRDLSWDFECFMLTGNYNKMCWA